MIKYQEVLCWITKYFPGLKENEIAFLAYVEKIKKSLTMDQSPIKAAWLHHLTPWSINKEQMKDTIDHQKLAVCIYSNGGDKRTSFVIKRFKKRIDRVMVFRISYCPFTLSNKKYK